MKPLMLVDTLSAGRIHLGTATASYRVIVFLSAEKNLVPPVLDAELKRFAEAVEIVRVPHLSRESASFLIALWLGQELEAASTQTGLIVSASPELDSLLEYLNQAGKRFRRIEALPKRRETEEERLIRREKEAAALLEEMLALKSQEEMGCHDGHCQFPDH